MLRYNPLIMDCIHGVKRDRCVHCRVPPEGVNSTVYITAGGRQYHNRRGCPRISEGQAIARAQGLQNHPVQAMPWSQVVLERDRCPFCCPVPNVASN